MAKTTIQAEIDLNTTKFQRGLARSQKSLGNFVKNGIAKFGALAGAAGFGALANSAINLGAEISNLSKVANTSEEEFQKMAFGANTFGVSMEKTADILKDVSDKVGDFLQTGGGPLKDFFENIAPKVGVTAEQFRNLSGKDALQLYVSSLQKANISQNEMTFFMEAIASDATLLLPLLKNNGQAMHELGEEALRLGLIMDKETIEKLKAASVEINKLKTIATILTGVFITKVMPAFRIIGNGLGFIGDVLGISAANFISFGKTIGTVLSAVIAPAISQLEALGLAIKAAGQFAKRDFAGAKESIKGAKDQVKETITAIKDIPEKLGDAFTKLGEDQKTAWETLGQSIDKRAKAITDDFKDITGEAEKAEKAVKKVDAATSPSGGGGSTAGSGQKLKEGGARGMNIEQGEFEARNDFLRRREKSRSANLTLQDKMQQQARSGESAGITDQLVLAAQGGGTSANPAALASEQAATDAAASLKIIEKELTRTTK